MDAALCIIAMIVGVPLLLFLRWLFGHTYRCECGTFESSDPQAMLDHLQNKHHVKVD